MSTPRCEACDDWFQDVEDATSIVECFNERSGWQRTLVCGDHANFIMGRWTCPLDGDREHHHRILPLEAA